MQNISRTMVDQIAEHVGRNIEVNITEDCFSATISGCLKDYDFDLTGLSLCVDDFNEVTFDLEKYSVYAEDGFDMYTFELVAENNPQHVVSIGLYI